MRLSAKAIIIKNNAILLIEYDDENGLHYNFPGGGQEEGESLPETLGREVMEEASAAIEVGPLLCVYEYVPYLCEERYGPKPSMSFLFQCTLKPCSHPAMPYQPDPNQTAVKWIPLEQLDQIILLPNLGQHVRGHHEKGDPLPAYVGEHELQPVYP